MALTITDKGYVIALLAAAESEVKLYERRLRDAAADASMAVRKADEMASGESTGGCSTGVLKQWGPELDVAVGQLHLAREWRDRMTKLCEQLGFDQPK